MKVYIVFNSNSEYYGDDAEVKGIFSSEEKAVEYIVNLGMAPTGYQNNYVGENELGYEFYAWIQEWEVQ